MFMTLLCCWVIVAVILVIITGTAQLDPSLTPQQEMEEHARLMIMGIAWPACLAIIIVFLVLAIASVLLGKVAKVFIKNKQSTERLN